SSLRHNRLKARAIGGRTGELYSKDPFKQRRIFGFELRAVNPRNPSAWLSFDDWLQYAALTGYYGLSRTALARWHDTHVGAHLSPAMLFLRQQKVLHSLHYNRSVAELLAAAPVDLQELPNFAKAAHRLERDGEKYYALKMVFHDWSLDPVLDN